MGKNSPSSWQASSTLRRTVSSFARNNGELGSVAEGLLSDSVPHSLNPSFPRNLGEVKGEDKLGGELGGKGLGGGDADLRPGVGGNRSSCAAGDDRADNVANGKSPAAPDAEFSRSV